MSKTSKGFLVAIALEFLIASPGLSSGFGEIWLAGTLLPTLLAWGVISIIDKRNNKQLAQNPSLAGQKDPHWRRNSIIIVIVAILFVIYSVIDNSY